MRVVTPYLLVALAAAIITYGLMQFVLVPTRGGLATENGGEQPALAPVDIAALDLSPEERINVEIYKKVNRSVVNITSRSVQTDDFFMTSTPREGTGSGSVLTKQGHILTNFHVIEDARQIVVNLFDGSSYEAKLIGADPNNDVAVLQIEAPAEKLYPISWGDSSKLVVGMHVYAIGNPFGLERTLTTGIVSSLNRSLLSENKRVIRGIIQTDAAINPGNSGGPLLNRRGEMVGITTAIVSRAGQSSGIGLAVPANTARRIVDDLLRFGKVVRADSGIFAVYELEKGLLIAKLVPDGPAEHASLHGPQVVEHRRGGYVYRSLDRSKADLIVAVDGRAVKTFEDFLSYVESKKPGDKVKLTVVREGKRMDVEVELEQSKG
jgi:S1-C subfamily serine protease